MKKTCVFLFAFILFIYPVSSANMYNHVYNGSSWVPALSTADGQQKYWINMANASYGEVQYNLTVGQKIGIGTKNPSQELNVVGDANITNNLIIEKNLTIGEKIIFNFGETIDNLADGWMRVVGNLFVDGDLNISGNLNVSKNLNVVGNIDVGGNVSIREKLNISGDLIVNNSNLYVDVTSGRVGIGTTVPAEKLEILKNSASIAEGSAGISIRSAPSSTKLMIGANDVGGYSFIQSMQQGVTWTGRPLSLMPNGGNVGIGFTDASVALDVNGDIEYTGTIADVSDRRLKENFVQINNSLSKINSLTGYTFNMINKTDRHAGVVAQEVQEVLPEAVSVVDEQGHLGVDYTQIVPLLLEGIKELKSENEGLKKRIEILEKEINEK
jgi:predicted acyltransferase (DUF342 family)